MNIEIESVLQAIVESFLPRFCDEKLGLLMVLDCSYTNHDNEIDVRFPLYYLIQRPSNYTKVLFLDVMDNKDFRCPPIMSDIIGKKDLPWLLRSDHDSCWRTDGFRNLLRIEYEVMEQFGGYPITHEKVSIYNSFGGLGNGIYYVELKPFRVDREESKQDIFIEKTLTVKEAAALMP